MLVSEAQAPVAQSLRAIYSSQRYSPLRQHSEGKGRADLEIVEPHQEKQIADKSNEFGHTIEKKRHHKIYYKYGCCYQQPLQARLCRHYSVPSPARGNKNVCIYRQYSLYLMHTAVCDEVKFRNAYPTAYFLR